MFMMKVVITIVIMMITILVWLQITSNLLDEALIWWSIALNCIGMSLAWYFNSVVRGIDTVSEGKIYLYVFTALTFRVIRYIVVNNILNVHCNYVENNIILLINQAIIHLVHSPFEDLLLTTTLLVLPFCPTPSELKASFLFLF